MNLAICNDNRESCRAKRGNFCLALDECYEEGHQCPFYKTQTTWVKECLELQKDGHPVYASTIHDD